MADRLVPHFQEELEQLKTRLLEMGGLAEERVRSSVQGLVDRDGALVDRVLGGDGRSTAAHRDRQPLLHAAGAAPADGRGPARHRVGGEDQHRPRAGRRSRDQHRRGGPALHAASAGQGADRHPAHGGHRAGRCCATRSTPTSAATSRWRRPSSTRTTRSTALKTQVFRELLTYMLQDPSNDRAVARPDPDFPPPRADRRPRHQRRRGRDLHGLRQGRPPPRRRGRARTADLTAPNADRRVPSAEVDTIGRFDAARTPLCVLPRRAGRPGVAAVLQRAVQACGSRALA